MIDRAELVKLRTAGMTLKAIGEKYGGVSRQYIAQCLKNVTIPTNATLTCTCGKPFVVALKGSGYRSKFCRECAAKKRSDTQKAKRAWLVPCECGKMKSYNATCCAECCGRNKINYPLAIWLYDFGYSTCKLAKYFGCSNVNVYINLNRRGVEMRERSMGHKASREAEAQMSIEQAAKVWKKKNKE